MADGVVLNSGSGGATAATDDCGASGHAQIVKLAIATDGSATLIPADASGIGTRLTGSSRSDTFTGTGNGTAVDVTAKPCKSFGVQVKGTGAAPTSWTVVLEASLDGTNYTTILTHTNTSLSDGAVLWSGAAVSPALYFRSRCSALLLGSATNIAVTIIGMP